MTWTSAILQGAGSMLRQLAQRGCRVAQVNLLWDMVCSKGTGMS
jgi:hypothetical protein